MINLLYIIAAFLAILTGPVFCEEETKLSALPAQELPVIVKMSNLITLELRNIDVVDALKFLALKANMSIVTNKSVSGKVNLKVENVPIQDVFDLMLRSNNLAYDKKGDIYNVMTEEEFKLLYGRRFSDVRQVKTFRLEYAVPEQVFTLLDTLKSEVGRALVDAESGSVMIMDSAEKIKEIEGALKLFEQKSIVKIFELNYAKASDVEEQLATQLDAKKAGSIKADVQGNRVIVQTLPERMKEVERLIKILDKKTKQVIIDAQIIKIKFSNQSDSGTEWEGLFNVAKKYGLTYLGSAPFSTVAASTDAWASRKATYDSVGYVGSYPFSGTTSNYSSSTPKVFTENMHLGVVGKHDFDLLLNFVKTLGETKILSNTKLAAVNNKEARIHVGTKEAYVTTTTTSGGSGPNTISEQVNFVDIGIVLNIVPTINEEGYVTLKLKTEVSSVLDVLVTPTGNKIPIIDTSLAETTVMIKEGTTIILGGLRKDEKTKSSTQVPFLGSIPIIGRLFSVKTQNSVRTELMIILTPRLMTGDILINPSGVVVGEGGVKSMKDYPSLPKKEEAVIPSEVYIPLDENNKKTNKTIKSRQENADFKGIRNE